MQVPVLIIMDANKQTMALIKVRSLWGQWKFWICTVASSGSWTLAMWGSRLGTSAGHCLVDTDTRGRYTGPSSRCGPDSEPFYYDRPSAISQEWISAAAGPCYDGVGSKHTINAMARKLSMRTNIGAGCWMFWQCISRIDQWQWSRIWSNEDHH